jgi:indolepyruvate ferredoxin oxidoreductase
MAKRNAKGELVKQKFGPWMLTGFAAGAAQGPARYALDVFGKTEERRPSAR